MRAVTGHAGWLTVSAVAVALAGLLAMHGFEAVLVAVEHGTSDRHGSTAAATPDESHVASGSCSVEKPGAATLKAVDSCLFAYSAPDTVSPIRGVEPEVVGFVRRAALAAFSILRV